MRWGRGPVATDSMAVVIITGGEYNAQHVEIPGNRMTLGRSVTCDVILRHKDVSDLHAQLVIRDNVCWVQDMCSAIGTVVKKKRIFNHPLTEGDEFSIGPYRFVLSDSVQPMAESAEATMQKVRRMLHEQLIADLNLKRMTFDQMADAS